MADLTLLNVLLDADLVTPVSLQLSGKQNPDQIKALQLNGTKLLAWARNIEKIARMRLQAAVDNCPGHLYEGGSHVCSICRYDSE